MWLARVSVAVLAVVLVHYVHSTDAACAKTHKYVGFSGALSELQHDVKGTLTVVDDCTITITNFHYDGRGPETYMYTGQDNDFSNGRAIGAVLPDTAVAGGTLTRTLPSGLTFDDFNSVSIWCVPFKANFGM
eukprot:TRINITY_DN2639_c0_g1_i1.p2 TRINITY_DN2639_c0_g1~~TRINITY_DN2639_c0_g1_i1.p2  ORF type:complete len:132 (+),score=27.36 TRINITY_DN2639_c0_g1_i1:132-527(+)